MKLVLVEWLDSAGANGWNALGDIKQSIPLECRSVGWLLSEKKGSRGMIILVSSIAGEERFSAEVRGDVTIPNRAVTKMTVLRK